MKKDKTEKVTTKKVVKTKKPSKIVNFIREVKKELGKVRWPNKKEMITYSIATVSFVLFFALFFSLSDLILSGIKMLVK